MNTLKKAPACDLVCQRPYRRETHHQRSVATFVPYMHPAYQRDGLAFALLAFQFFSGAARQPVKLRQDFRQCLQRQPLFHSLFLADGLVCQAHSISRQNTCQWMHKNLCHSECIGHQTGMLPTSTSKTLQGVACHVIPARHTDFFDGVGHLLHRDLNETLRTVFSGSAGQRCQRCKAGLHDRQIKFFISSRAKNLGKIARLHLANQYVGICYRQWATTPITRRARVGTRTLWAHPESGAIKRQQGAATCSNRMNTHHRRAHSHACHLGFKFPFKLTSEMGYVCRCAAHVKADHLGVPTQGRGTRHTHNATGGPTQNGILAGKCTSVCQTT